MTGNSRIIAFGSAETDNNREEMLLTPDAELAPETPEYPDETDAWVEPSESDEAVRATQRDWLVPAIAGGAALLWTAFFIAAHVAEFSAATPLARFAELLTAWSVPIALIGVIWLLAMRNSRREAARFGDAARLLSRESAELETRLSVVNQELSLAREFIAAQSRDLEALGRMASERLSQNAERLQDLIGENGARIDSIGNVSKAALDNMEKLRGQLPVIASSAKDVTNNIGNAGRTAHSQLEDMVNGFKRINDFGQACERQIYTLRDVVDSSLQGFTGQCEKLEEIASARFAELNDRSTEFRTQLDSHEVEALAAIRTRAAALVEEFENTRARLDSEEAESLTSLRARLSALREEGAAVSRSLREGELQAGESWRDRLNAMEEDRDRIFGEFARIADQAYETMLSRRQAIEADITEMESRISASARETDTAIGERRERAEAESAAVLRRLRETLASMDHELADRSRALTEGLEERRGTLEAAGLESAARFGEIFAGIDAQLDEQTARHERRATTLAEHSDALVNRLSEYDRRLAEIASRAAESESAITASLETIAERLSESRSQTGGAKEELDQLTDASVRLLELLQASANQTREELPEALERSQDLLSSFENRISELRAAIDEAGSDSTDIAGHIETSGSALKLILLEIDRMQTVMRDRSAAHETTLAKLREQIATLETDSERLSEKAQGDLAQAISALDQAARSAVASIGSDGAGAISALAERLGEESAEAIDRAVRARASEAAGKLEQAAAHAAGISREATIQLRDQLAKVDELTGNLEQRVARARERAEEQVDHDFARRAALITESLNSNAIDIAKALSTDVSDNAWESYLRGDRGIFTRRAVSLIEANEVKTIQQIFERDPGFRDHVSRYIHDFEAMLRQVLSTRDGNALGVTLLSSDMGKLYVALAQGIERLRT